MSDKIIAIREIKMTVSFVIPEQFANMVSEYMPKIDEWVKSILQDFNGKLSSSEITPLSVYAVSKDVTD